MNIWLHKHTRPLVLTALCFPTGAIKDLDADFLHCTSLEFPAYVESMSNCQMLASTLCHQIISFSSHKPTGIWTWNTLRRIFSFLLSLAAASASQAGHRVRTHYHWAQEPRPLSSGPYQPHLTIAMSSKGLPQHPESSNLLFSGSWLSFVPVKLLTQEAIFLLHLLFMCGYVCATAIRGLFFSLELTL